MRILETDEKAGSERDIFQEAINYRGGGAADRLETRRTQEQARYFRDGNIDGCS